MWIPFDGKFYPGSQSEVVHVEYIDGVRVSAEARQINWDEVCMINITERKRENLWRQE